MKTTFVEATSPQGNWGKFMVGVFERHEVERPSSVDGRSIIWGRGWDRGHVFVLDLQTGEGATFRMGGLAKYDLDKHKIWVCVLFEAFLEWLYLQPDPMDLPPTIELDVPLAFAGYRRPGDSMHVCVCGRWATTKCGACAACRNNLPCMDPP